MHDEEYVKDFIARLKEVFPDSARLHENLDAHPTYIDRPLSDLTGEGNLGINSETIAGMIEAGEVQKLHAMAERNITRAKFWIEWCDCARPAMIRLDQKEGVSA